MRHTNKIQQSWEINPSLYMTNDDGSFILKKDGTPKKKSGRPSGSRMSLSQKIKNIRKKEKEIQRLIDYVQAESLELPLKKRTTSTIPFGYKLNIQTNELEPIQSELDCLKEVEKKYYQRSFLYKMLLIFYKRKQIDAYQSPDLKK